MLRNHLKKTYTLASICAVSSICLFGGTLAAYDYTYYFDKYDIEVLNSDTVETTYPSRAKPNPEQDKKDIYYWVNEVLPDKNAKNAEMYIVYPTHGMVIPVLEPNATDLKLIQQ